MLTKEVVTKPVVRGAIVVAKAISTGSSQSDIKRVVFKAISRGSV